MQKTEKDLKDEITKILIELGVPINLQGFKYFRECIFQSVKKPSLLSRVTKYLYPKVASVYKVSEMVVERCMRHASEQAFYKTKFLPIIKYYGLSDPFTYKPTNSELVALIAEYIRIKTPSDDLLDE